MVMKNKGLSYLTKIIAFGIILGILATILIFTVGKEQMGTMETFFGDRFRNIIGPPTFQRPILGDLVVYKEDGFVGIRT